MSSAVTADGIGIAVAAGAARAAAASEAIVSRDRVLRCDMSPPWSGSRLWEEREFRRPLIQAVGDVSARAAAALHVKQPFPNQGVLVKRFITALALAVIAFPATALAMPDEPLGSGSP